MMASFSAYLLCIAFILRGAHGVPSRPWRPSDRLRYDRSKANGKPLAQRGGPARGSKGYDMSKYAEKVENDAEVGDVDEGVAPAPEVRVAPVAPQADLRPLRPVAPKCRVSAIRPYNKSPVIEVRGVRGLFNSILVGYQSPNSLTRENKGSMFGWSTVIDGGDGTHAAFTFNANYTSINTVSQPSSYCALIIQPPLSVNPDTLRAFASPPRHVKRSLLSTDAFAKFLREHKSRIVTSCCFLAELENETV